MANPPQWSAATLGRKDCAFAFRPSVERLEGCQSFGVQIYMSALAVLAGRNEQVSAQEIDCGPTNANVLLFSAHTRVQGDIKLGKMLSIFCQDDLSQSALFIQLELV